MPLNLPLGRKWIKIMIDPQPAFNDTYRLRQWRRRNRSHGDTRYGGQRAWVWEQASKRYGKALFAPENQALWDKLCLFERHAYKGKLG